MSVTASGYHSGGEEEDERTNQDSARQSIRLAEPRFVPMSEEERRRAVSALAELFLALFLDDNDSPR